MKTIEINGVTFDVRRPRKNTTSIYEACAYLHRNQSRDLWSCYRKPSAIKIDIYKDWLKWYTDCDKNLQDFCITSYNSNFFNLGALYYDIETNTHYLLSITKSHNTATQLVLD